MKKREIKFRGKRSDTGEWVVGNLHLPNKLFTSPYICPDTTFLDSAPGFEDGDDYEEAILQGTAIGYYFPVIPETIGEFTNYKDKNGKEIYEDDILAIPDRLNELIPFVMTWETERAEWTKFHPRDKFEVIGNIFDNPELNKYLTHVLSLPFSVPETCRRKQATNE